jgi:hypothetical protein
VSQTRLVAAKTAAKPAKLAAAPKTRSASNAPPAAAANIGKPKGRVSSAPAPTSGAPVTRSAAAVAHANGAEERPTKGGQTKNELKAQFAKLSNATAQIAGLKRALNKSFFDIGVLLNQVRNERLYEVKGYGSFEAFVEREIDINKAICLKLTRIAEVLHHDQALAAGLERAAAAVAALDGETEPSALVRPGGSPAGGVPLHKQ